METLTIYTRPAARKSMADRMIGTALTGIRANVIRVEFEDLDAAIGSLATHRIWFLDARRRCSQLVIVIG